MTFLLVSPLVHSLVLFSSHVPWKYLQSLHSWLMCSGGTCQLTKLLITVVIEQHNMSGFWESRSELSNKLAISCKWPFKIWLKLNDIKIQFLRHTSHISSIQKPLVMSGYSFGFWTAQLWNISITVEMSAGQCYPRFTIQILFRKKIIFGNRVVRSYIFRKRCAFHDLIGDL